MLPVTAYRLYTLQIRTFKSIYNFSGSQAEGCEVVPELLDAVTAAVAAEVVAPADPANEGPPWEQAARMRAVARAVVKVGAVRVGVMVSPGERA